MIPSWNYKEVAFGEPYDFINECTSPGLMCETCKKLVQCIETEPGNFTKILIEECNAAKNFTCLKNKCSTAINPRCVSSSTGFKCTHSGIFPDPYDCTRYHICMQQKDIVGGKANQMVPMQCQGKYGYDPVSTYCKIPLTDGACPDTPPVPECRKSGQSGPIQNTSIYYICLQNLVPQLFMCPHGTVYIDSKCTAPSHAVNTTPQ